MMRTYYKKLSVLFVVGALLLNTTPQTYAQVPDAPVLSLGQVGDGSVRLIWTPPKNSGGSSVTGYQIGYMPVGEAETTINVGNIFSYQVTGLTNGTTYRFLVRAVNSSGVGADSNQVSGQPVSSVTVPSAPSTPSLTRGDGTINISWVAPSNNGGAAITSYIVSYRIGAGTEQTTTVEITSHQLTGLTGGDTYTVRVRAVNSAGSGTYSNTASITAAQKPGAPTGLIVIPGDGTLALSWTESPANGAAISNYILWYRDESNEEVIEIENGVTSTSYTITGLTNGQNYTVKVKSENEIGESSYSTEKLVAPDINAEPMFVGTPNVVPSQTSASITWSTNKTMSSWIDYGLISATVSTSEYNTSSRVTDHTVVLSNLLPCTTYTYRAYSRDVTQNTVTSSNKTFTTTGCPLSAPVLATERDSVVVADGGILDFRTGDIKTKFTIPSEVTCLCSVMTVQAKKLDKESVQTGIGAPDQKTWLGEHVYNFTAYKDEDEVIEQFDLPVDVTIEYTQADVDGIDLDTLRIHHYDEDTEEWSVLTECRNTYDNGTQTGTITCKTMSFSTFVLATVEETKNKKPSFRERFEKLLSNPFKKFSFRKFSRCGIENPE